MAKSKYVNVRNVIAGMLCDDEFEIIDEAMKGKQGVKLVIAPANADIGGWEKADTDLQEGMSVDGTTIQGKLKYVADYTGAGFSADDHYFVYLLADTTIDQEKYDIKVGINQLTTLDEEKDVVLAVKKNNKKPIKLQVVDKTTNEIVDEDAYTLNVSYLPAPTNI